MREAVADDIYGEFTAAATNLASLYEPYRGSYPEYYPHPLPWEYPLFQPGFNYSFVDCCCDYQQPSVYEDTSFTYGSSVLNISKFETDYSLITHPNHTAICIDIPPCSINGQSTRRCYDNYYTPPVIGGAVVTFNDGVFNTNVTITPQDSTSINNPRFIDNLQPGLYNIIEDYQNGTNQETVILKEIN